MGLTSMFVLGQVFEWFGEHNGTCYESLLDLPGIYLLPQPFLLFVSLEFWWPQPSNLE